MFYVHACMYTHTHTHTHTLLSYTQPQVPQQLTFLRPAPGQSQHDQHASWQGRSNQQYEHLQTAAGSVNPACTSKQKKDYTNNITQCRHTSCTSNYTTATYMTREDKERDRITTWINKWMGKDRWVDGWPDRWTKEGMGK